MDKNTDSLTDAYTKGAVRALVESNGNFSTALKQAVESVSDYALAGRLVVDVNWSEEHIEHEDALNAILVRMVRMEMHERARANAFWLLKPLVTAQERMMWRDIRTYRTVMDTDVVTQFLEQDYLENVIVCRRCRYFELTHLLETKNKEHHVQWQTLSIDLSDVSFNEEELRLISCYGSVNHEVDSVIKGSNTDTLKLVLDNLKYQSHQLKRKRICHV